MPKNRGLRPKRIPERTCVGCRAQQVKRELVRIVRSTDGRVEVDPTGKKSGRGAYLHRSKECWRLGLQRDALEHALKVRPSADDRAALERYAGTLG